MKLITVIALSAFLCSCSAPPAPPKASGEWVPVNRANITARGE